MYDPMVGAFLSEDPDGFAAGDPNFYRYVGNHPTYAKDPDGLAEQNLSFHERYKKDSTAAIKAELQRMTPVKLDSYAAALGRRYVTPLLGPDGTGLPRLVPPIPPWVGRSSAEGWGEEDYKDYARYLIATDQARMFFDGDWFTRSYGVKEGRWFSEEEVEAMRHHYQQIRFPLAGKDKVVFGERTLPSKEDPGKVLYNKYWEYYEFHRNLDSNLENAANAIFEERELQITRLRNRTDKESREAEKRALALVGATLEILGGMALLPTGLGSAPGVLLYLHGFDSLIATLANRRTYHNQAFRDIYVRHGHSDNAAQDLADLTEFGYVVGISIAGAKGAGYSASRTAGTIVRAGGTAVEAGSSGGNTIRVTQFYNPKTGTFGPGASEALVAPPNRNVFIRLAEGPITSTPTARTWVSPFPASEQNWWTRMWTGRGTFRHYVEFDVLPSELQSVGGAKWLAGLGRYQKYVSGPVSLPGRHPAFGQLGPNYGQWIFIGGLGAAGAGTVYWVTR